MTHYLLYMTVEVRCIVAQSVVYWLTLLLVLICA